MSGLDLFLQSELNVLGTEAKKKFQNIKDAADKVIALLRVLKAQAVEHNVDVAVEIFKKDEVMLPFLLSFETKQPRLVAISMNCVQKMIMNGAVAESSLATIISVMRDDAEFGQDIQLKILQTLLPLLTSYPSITGLLLGEVLLICLRLYSAKLPVVSNTAAATLEQLVICCFDKVVTELQGADAGTETSESFTNIASAQATLKPFAKDAFLLFQDICLLTNGDAPEWLKIGAIPRPFGLELVGAVLAAHHQTFARHKAFHTLLRDRVCPMVIKTFSDRSQYRQTVRLLRVMSVLITELYDIVTMECEVFLLMLIKTIEAPADGPAWPRILALEMFRKFSADMNVVMLIYRHYDKQNTTTLFADITKMCARIVDTQFKVDSSSSSSSDQLSLPVLKVACLDQLDKSDTPSVPDNYAGGLALSILLNVVDGMSARVLPVFFEGGNQPSLVDGVIAPSLSAEQRESVKEIGEMVVACWPSVLQAISALLNRTSPNDEAFNMVLFKAVQNIATLSGVLGLEAPRDAFLAALRKYALPANDDGQVIESTAAYSEKNFQSLQTLFTVAQSLAGVLRSSWQIVFDALQQVDRVLHLASGGAGGQSSSSVSGAAPSTPMRPTSASSRTAMTPRGHQALSRTASSGSDANIHVLQSSIRNLFESVQYLSDDATAAFLLSLCQITLATAKPKGSSAESRSFGVAKITEASMHIIDRLLVGESKTWDTVMDTLTVLAASEDAGVRMQASEAITEIVHAGVEKIEYKKVEATPELQERLLRPLLTAARIPFAEVQAMQLQMLYQMLQTGGHSMTHSWPLILEALSSVAEKAAQQKLNPAIESTLKYAFQSLQLVCSDFIIAMNSACLHHCIATLGHFMAQTIDINVSLTAVGLMWNLADFTRGHRNRLNKEAAAAAPTDDDAAAAPTLTSEEIEGLWVALLQRLVLISAADRPEVRNGAIQILFRTINSNGALFAPPTWHTCLTQVLEPLLECVRVGGRRPASASASSPLTPSTPSVGAAPGIVMHHSRNTVEKQWDESRVIAMNGVGKTLAKHLSVLLHVVPADTTAFWTAFIGYLSDFALKGSQEVAVASFKCLDELLSACHKDAALRDDASLAPMWRAAWAAWERVGLAIVEAGASQDALVAFVRSFGAIHDILAASFGIADVEKLFAVLRSVLAAPLGDGTRDQDQLAPVQAMVLKQVDRLDPPPTSADPKSPSAVAPAPPKQVNVDPAVHAFVLGQLAVFAKMSCQHLNSPSGMPTFVAFSSKSMDRLVELFSSSLSDASLFTSDGVFCALIDALALPMALRHACPGPKAARPGASWRTAVKLFLLAAKAGLAAVESLDAAVGDAALADIWTHVFAALESCLLFGASGDGVGAASVLVGDDNDEDEVFEISVVTTVRAEILPLLHRAPARVQSHAVAFFRSGVYFGDGGDVLASPTSASSRLPPPREKLAAACLESLYFLASKAATNGLAPGSVKHSVYAALAVHAGDAVMQHAAAVLQEYVLLRAQSGALPLPRIKQGEVALVLGEALRLDLHPAALSTADGANARIAALPYANRHLFLLYSHMVNCLLVADRPVLSQLQAALRKIGSEMGLDGAACI